MSCLAYGIRPRVVYFCDNVRDLVLSEIGSFRFWMVGGIADSLLDLVRLVIGSWSPLELISTRVFFGIVSNFFCTAPLEVMDVFFLGHPWKWV